MLIFCCGCQAKVEARLTNLWQSGKWKRKDLYDFLSAELGFKYHTAKIRNLNEAEKVWRLLRSLVAKKS